MAEAQKVVEANGGVIKAFYYTLGQYDFVTIAEDRRTETLVAIPAEKAAELLKTLP